MSNRQRNGMAWRFLCRFVGGGGIVVFFLSAFTPVPNLMDHWLSVPARIEPADAIVVLAAGVDEDGALTINSMRRVLRGIALYKEGLAPLLVLSGPRAADAGRPEAEVRAQLARDMGIAPSAVLMLTTARTTRAEAIELEHILPARGVRRILLVTHAEHMDRAQRLFARAGFEVLAAPVLEYYDASAPEDRLALARGALQEMGAQLYYRVAGYL
jgi:uncharacterized SAM-binding protein YcdF (DUF218 family)